jgi:hypothetical protein
MGTNGIVISDIIGRQNISSMLLGVFHRSINGFDIQCAAKDL